MRLPRREAALSSADHLADRIGAARGITGADFTIDVGTVPTI